MKNKELYIKLGCENNRNAILKQKDKCKNHQNAKFATWCIANPNLEIAYTN